MPSEKEKAEETVSPVSSGDKAPSKKESTAPASSKKDDKKEDELSEEDLAKKEEVNLLVERVQDPSEEIQKNALDILLTEVKSSTSSMTSVPVTLKFLRPHYPSLKDTYEKTAESNKNRPQLASILSVLAMSMADPKDCESLKYFREGGENVGSWGHEYVRNLASEVMIQFEATEREELDMEGLNKVIDEIVSFNMDHHAEPDACDLLLEVEQLDKILTHVDSNNCDRVALYLLSNASYAPEPEDVEILRIVLKVYRNLKKLPEALVLAMKLDDCDVVQEIIVEASDDLPLRAQLAAMVGRQRFFSFEYEDDEEFVNETLGNNSLSHYFLELGKSLDVMEPKVPEDIYKTHLLDTRYAANLAQQGDSAIQNLAATFVNAFVNTGFGTDKLMTEDGAKWVYKNKNEGKLAATASLAMINLWNADDGIGVMDKYVYSADEDIKAGALLGFGVVASGIKSAHDPSLTLLADHVESTESERCRIAAILGLGIAYAGHAREEVKELILPIVEDCGLSLELVGIASLALGLVYVGSCNSEITEAISAALLERPVESLDESTHTRFIGLGLGLLYLGKQSQAEVPLELVKVVEGNAGKYAELCLETCAYAGTGSVLKIQRLLHVCGDDVAAKAEEKDKKEESSPPVLDCIPVAVLGIALIANAEDVGLEMSLRTFDHLLQYGTPAVRRAVPLALGFLSVSNPRLSVVDTLSKLSHDNDAMVSQGAIFSLGLVGAGTNNARIAGLLRQLSAYYSKDNQQLFVVRLAQGILHFGKGTITLDPFHTHRLLMSNVGVAGLLATLHVCSDVENLVHKKHHYLLYLLACAAHPRMLIALDSSKLEAGEDISEDLESIEATVRVGQAVDIVGQAGRPKTITGFQTHSTPVVIGSTEQAELATEEFIPLSPFLENLVLLKKNPEWTEDNAN